VKQLLAHFGLEHLRRKKLRLTRLCFLTFYAFHSLIHGAEYVPGSDGVDRPTVKKVWGMATDIRPYTKNLRQSNAIISFTRVVFRLFLNVPKLARNYTNVSSKCWNFACGWSCAPSDPLESSLSSPPSQSNEFHNHALPRRLRPFNCRAFSAWFHSRSLSRLQNSVPVLWWRSPALQPDISAFL